jgi:hypothetical protein
MVGVGLLFEDDENIVKFYGNSTSEDYTINLFGENGDEADFDGAALWDYCSSILCEESDLLGLCYLCDVPVFELDLSSYYDGNEYSEHSGTDYTEKFIRGDLYDNHVLSAGIDLCLENNDYFSYEDCISSIFDIESGALSDYCDQVTNNENSLIEQYDEQYNLNFGIDSELKDSYLGHIHLGDVGGEILSDDDFSDELEAEAVDVVMGEDDADNPVLYLDNINPISDFTLELDSYYSSNIASELMLENMVKSDIGEKNNTKVWRDYGSLVDRDVFVDSCLENSTEYNQYNVPTPSAYRNTINSVDDNVLVSKQNLLDELLRDFDCGLYGDQPEENIASDSNINSSALIKETQTIKSDYYLLYQYIRKADTLTDIELDTVKDVGNSLTLLLKNYNPIGTVTTSGTKVFSNQIEHTGEDLNTENYFKNTIGSSVYEIKRENQSGLG